MALKRSRVVEFGRMPATANKKFRVQLDFNEKDFTEINSLVEELGLSTRAELFRSAIVSLRWLAAKKRAGCTVVAITQAERLIEPEFEFLQSVSRLDDQSTVAR